MRYNGADKQFHLNLICRAWKHADFINIDHSDTRLDVHLNTNAINIKPYQVRFNYIIFYILWIFMILLAEVIRAHLQVSGL